MSFSSVATNNYLNERSFSFSGDVRGSLYNESDTPHHAEDVNRYAWSLERHPALREYSIKVPKAHSFLETDSPGSRCYSCSTGHYPPSSPLDEDIPTTATLTASQAKLDKQWSMKIRRRSCFSQISESPRSMSELSGMSELSDPSEHPEHPMSRSNSWNL